MAFNSTGDSFISPIKMEAHITLWDTIGEAHQIFRNGSVIFRHFPYGGGLNGHEIIFSPDYSKYFISCDATNDYAF